ncbi:DnaJ domain-containing protein [bacterium]|nr:DnaJ domain-containing protein [candidate division CSSED10-310 bacterium]
MSIPDILQWLADSNKTGTLKVTCQSEQKKIFLKDGMIVSASSTLDKDRFGVLIVKEGYVTQEQLLNLLEEGKAKNKLLGALCVEKNIITESEVKTMLQKQTERIIESLFHRKEGEFVFDENELPDQEVVPISILMHQLFFDSAAKRNEWLRIHNLLGRLDTVLKPASAPPKPVSTLSEFEQSILTMCNGTNPVTDICARIDRSDFEICSTLAHLLEDKWLHKSTEAIPPENVILQEKLWQASILLEQKRYLQATQILESEKANFPGRAEIDTLLKKSYMLLKQDITKLFPSEDIKPNLMPDFDAKLLQKLHFKSQEWFVYSQINGQTSMKNLYRISGLGKEATQRIVYMLIKIGAVGIKQPGRSFRQTRTPTPKLQLKDIIGARGEADSREKTGEYMIPDRYLRKSASAENNRKDSEKTPPDLKELSRIYSKYLKMNNYQILGISRQASPAKIRDAFVSLSKRYHPDMHTVKLPKPVQDRLEELFSIVNHAYSVLSNPISRKRYDEEVWANERLSEKNLDDLSVLIQTPKPMPVVSIKEDLLKKPNSPKKPETKKADEQTQEIPIVSRMDWSGKSAESKPGKTAQPQARWESLLEEGTKLLKENKLTQAIQSFDSAIKYNAKNPLLYYRLSVAQYKQGKPGLEKAEENVKRALVLDRENPTYFCHLARIQYGKGNLSEAERYTKTALAWDPTNVEAKKLLTEFREASSSWLGKLKFKKKK